MTILSLLLFTQSQSSKEVVPMFLVEDNKSPFYEIVYIVDVIRTKKLTKKRTKVEVIKVTKQLKKQ